MDKDNLIPLVYSALREEIKDSKARIFISMGFGVTAVPSAIQIFKDVPIILSLLPFIVSALILNIISEKINIAKCASYIRKEIESKITDFVGWETWLEDVIHTDNVYRKSDRYFKYSILMLFFIYYVGSVIYFIYKIGSDRIVYGISTDLFKIIVSIIYLIFGVYMLYTMKKQIKVLVSGNIFHHLDDENTKFQVFPNYMRIKKPTKSDENSLEKS